MDTHILRVLEGTLSLEAAKSTSSKEKETSKKQIAENLLLREIAKPSDGIKHSIEAILLRTLKIPLFYRRTKRHPPNLSLVCILAYSNTVLSPLEILPIAQENRAQLFKVSLA